jgi:hypothetical protein
MSGSARRVFGVATLSLTLACPLLAGGTPRRNVLRPTTVATGQSVWNWLVSVWEREGSSIDPFGSHSRRAWPSSLEPFAKSASRLR